MRRPGRIISRYELLELPGRARSTTVRTSSTSRCGGCATRSTVRSGEVHRDRPRGGLPAVGARTLLRRLPVRAKLTLAYAAVIAVVLSGIGLFLYANFKSGLDAA